jgi:hypothetical protein
MDSKKRVLRPRVKSWKTSLTLVTLIWSAYHSAWWLTKSIANNLCFCGAYSLALSKEFQIMVHFLNQSALYYDHNNSIYFFKKLCLSESILSPVIRCIMLFRRLIPL